MRAKITDKVASQLKPGQQVFDSQVPGFGLRCQGDTKTWFLRYRSSDKRQKLVTIGRLGEQWTPARARDEALRLRALHVTGEDPARTRSEFKQSPTVRQLAEQYMATHGKRKRTASEDQRRLDRHVLPALGDLRVASVTVPDVERLHVWENIRGQADIADCRMHDLRHSFASALVSAGVSLPVIGGLLGHTQPATTARYSHLQDEALRAAAGLAAAKLS